MPTATLYWRASTRWPLVLASAGVLLALRPALPFKVGRSAASWMR